MVQQIALVVRHIAGEKNVIADMFSRWANEYYVEDEQAKRDETDADDGIFELEPDTLQEQEDEDDEDLELNAVQTRSTKKAEEAKETETTEAEVRA